MKISKTFIASVLVFFIINTQCFWISKVGHHLFLFFLLLFIAWLVLLSILSSKTFKIFRSEKRSTLAIVQCILSFLLLFSVAAYPKGIADLKAKQYPPAKIKAFRKGVGGCGNTLYLREDSTFLDRSVCFGISEIEGSYRMCNDTIYFNCDNYYVDYGLIDTVAIRCHHKKHSNGSELMIYTIVPEMN